MLPVSRNCVVSLSGLKAKPELNGKTGLAVRFVPEKGRWQAPWQLEGVESSQLRA